MNNVFFQVLLIAFASALLSACSDAPANGGTFVSCNAEPSACVVVEATRSSGCLLPNGRMGNEWAAWSPKGKNAVTVALREELDVIGVTPRPPRLTTNSIIELKAGGDRVSLGCERTYPTASNERWDERRFIPLSYCTPGSCPFKATKPTSTRSGTCEQSCSRGEAFCLYANLDPTEPMAKALAVINRELIAASPSKVPFSTLTSALTGAASVCARSDAPISATGTFDSVGGVCQLDFKLLPSTSNAMDSIALNLPAVVRGTHKGQAGSYELTPVEPAIAFPTVRFQSPTNGFTEPISKIVGRSRQITLETPSTYCAVIPIPE